MPVLVTNGGSDSYLARLCYEHRSTKEFVQRYKVLVPNLRLNSDQKKAAVEVLDGLKISRSQFQVR